MYGTKCSGCKTTIPANEFVMRALGNVYHIQCFVCTMCGHRLEKGQEFALKDNKLYCKEDFGKLPIKGSSNSPPHRQQQESKSILEFYQCDKTSLIARPLFRKKKKETVRTSSNLQARKRACSQAKQFLGL